MQLTSPRQNNAYRPITILDHVFFVDDTDICGIVAPTEQQQVQPDPTRTNSTVNDDRIEDTPDKCDLFLSSNRAIIKQKNFSSEGVQGRLKPCLRFWHETLQCSQFVHNVIERGYVLPLKATPPPVFLRNNRSALDHPEFVEQSINQLLKLRCIKECTNDPPTAVNPLSVAKGKKLRLVLDLRHVNPYVQHTASLSEVFQQGFKFFTFDLESGYHHIDIYTPHQQFLGFSWNFDSKTRYFVFTVLPFGLSSACYLFTKMLRTFVRSWRSMGHCAFIYIDDGMSGTKSLITAKAASTIQRADLSNSGLKANESKSHWEPMLVAEWLGFIINTIQMTFQVLQRKVDKLRNQINGLILSTAIEV